MSDAEIKPAGRLLVLDAFRAIAIAGVMLHHYLSRWAPPDNPVNVYGYRHAYPQWLDVGALGVQFFFMISGFVIFMTLERCGHLLEFWTRRIARLYPSYIVCMAITFLVVAAIGPVEFSSGLADLPANLFFLTPFVAGAKFVEPAYWSLIVELQFYFWIGIIFAVSAKRFNSLWTAFCAVALVFWMIGNLPHLHVFGSFARNVLLVTYLPEFTFGILCYRLLSRNYSGAWLLGCASLGLYLAVARDASLASHSAHAAMAGAFVLFLMGKLDFLCQRPILFAGAISYPFYLLHQYVGVSLIGALTRKWAVPDLVAAMFAVFFCGVLAFLVHRWVELPAKTWIISAMLKRLKPLQAHFPHFSFSKPAAAHSFR